MLVSLVVLIVAAWVYLDVYVPRWLVPWEEGPVFLCIVSAAW